MSKINWNFVQNNSNKILSDGCFKLNSQNYSNFSSVIGRGYGNYLISLNEVPYYVGEAKDILSRIKQQSNSKNSTFFKNYLKTKNADKKINDFKIQIIQTSIGRKEIEEFGIVNYPTVLNKFQLGKRNRIEITSHNELWDEVQNNFSEVLKQGESELLTLKFVFWFDLKLLSTAGLYLVKDKNDKLIYVGESSSVEERITTHSGRTYFSALRRHIGTEILGYELQEIKGKKRYFSDKEDLNVTDFLRECKAVIFPVNFGRYELEEYLIKKYRPLLNRKDNKE